VLKSALPSFHILDITLAPNSNFDDLELFGKILKCSTRLKWWSLVLSWRGITMITGLSGAWHRHIFQRAPSLGFGRQVALPPIGWCTAPLCPVPTCPMARLKYPLQFDHWWTATPCPVLARCCLLTAQKCVPRLQRLYLA
jgi:hypothetical protein